MGQEIDHTRFSAAEFKEFRRRLRAETDALIEFIEQAGQDDEDFVAGLELETCLVEAEGCRPAMRNQELLHRLASADASAELALHNVEFNTAPCPLTGDALGRMHAELRALVIGAQAVAATLDARFVLCGILPTLRESDLTLANMSPLKRYTALNEQTLRARRRAPIHLDIAGRERLVLDHGDVMLEAATTSLQVHLRAPRHHLRRVYNASLLVSAAVLGVAANSPFLFGRDLWDETRIPLFEQAIALPGRGGVGGEPLRRVSFGSGFARRSVLECFVENLEHFPVLLPVLDERGHPYAHLRLHNGTIWRWNRPIVGFDTNGEPHIRLEHRSLPAGPSLIDGIANIAFYLGLVRHYQDAPVEDLEFARVRDNFYAAARLGLNAGIDWIDGERHNLRDLAMTRLLGEARHGLEALGLDATGSTDYLDVIAQRLARRQTGADWQRRYLQARPGDFAGLTALSIEYQREDLPVHLWELP